MNQQSYRLTKSGIVMPGDQRFALYHVKAGNEKDHRPYDKILALAVNQYGRYRRCGRGSDRVVKFGMAVDGGELSRLGNSPPSRIIPPICDVI